MKEKLLRAVNILGLTLVILAILLGGCAKPAPTPAPAPTPPPAPTPEPIVLKAVSFFPETNLRTQAYLDFLSAVSERSKGELRFDYLGGQEVIPVLEQGMALKNGVVDISSLSSGQYRGLVPMGTVLPLSRITAKEEREGGFVDLFREAHAKGGLFYLGRNDPKNDLHAYLLLTKRVENPSVLAELKLASTAAWTETFSKFLSPSWSIIPYPDAYTALDTGVIDGWWCSLDGVQSFSLQEVAKYVIDHPVYVSDIVMIMGLDSWNRLPEHLQDLIEEVYVEWEPELITRCRGAITAARKMMEEAGVEFMKFSPTDAKWYVENAYQVEAEKVVKEDPEHGPRLVELLKALK